MNQEGRVTTERHGHVLLIGLDRAAKRNAFDRAMLSALALAYGELSMMTTCVVVCYLHMEITSQQDWNLHNSHHLWARTYKSYRRVLLIHLASKGQG